MAAPRPRVDPPGVTTERLNARLAKLLPGWGSTPNVDSRAMAFPVDPHLYPDVADREAALIMESPPERAS
jgi:hypothetical protein